MRRVVLWSLLALSLSANATLGVAAVARRAGLREPPLFSKVALDDGQRARILELRRDLLEARAAQARRMEALRGELADVLVARPDDRAAIDPVLGRIEETQASFQRRIVTHVMAVRGVLRPDQRPAFEKLMSAQMRAGAPLAGDCAPAGGAR